MTKPQPREVYESWMKLVALVEKQGRTILDLVAHPDATPEQIMEVAAKYRETRGALRKHKPVILDYLGKHIGQGFHITSMLNKVMETRV